MVARRKAKTAKSVKARPPKISRGMTTGEAFQAIACSCLQHLHENHRILQDRGEPDALHQLRVAIRRLRAALSIFRHMVRDDESRRLNVELRWIAKQLANARDHDVYLENGLKPAIRERPDDQALAAHALEVMARRDTAYDEALATIGSQRFGNAVRDTAAWVAGGRWLRAAGAKARLRNGSIEDFASFELSRRTKRLRKRGENLEALSASERHRLRIAVKKLRYATEFLAPAFKGSGRATRAKALQKALGGLQDRLGLLNDIAVRKTISNSFGEQNAAKELLGLPERSELQTRLAAGQKAFAKFRTAEPFW